MSSPRRAAAEAEKTPEKAGTKPGAISAESIKRAKLELNMNRKQIR